MQTEEANRLPLDQILLQLGFSPVKVKHEGQEIWYSSPNRTEENPSFHISLKWNRALGEYIWVWNDFGDVGGSVVDFALRHWGFPDTKEGISAALRKLDEKYGNLVGTPLPSPPKSSSAPSHPFTDIKIEPLKNRRLLEYLEQRGIDAKLAKRYLQQVHYRCNGKPFSALAFANDLANDQGGYEIRSTGNFKGCLPPKTITLLHPEKLETRREITIFEGYIDYLSALTWYRKSEADTPVLILNSIVTEKAAIEKIQSLGVSKVHLYLDRDDGGKKVKEQLIKALPNLEIIDHSTLYDGYKDFNEFLVAKQKGRGR